MKTTRPWALVLAILLLLAFLGRPLYADPLLPRPPADSAGQKIAPALSQAMASSASAELIPVIITLKQQADLSGLEALEREERIRQVVQILQDTAAATQGPIRAFLESEGRAGNAGPVTPFWIFNGLAVPLAQAAIDRLAARPDVQSITLDATFSAPSSETSPSIEPNLTQVNAPALWDLGYRGQEIVVASMDTGVDGDHPDLVAQWRGGTNSWFDPHGEHPDVPYDASGHGTQSMGVMVGGSAGDSAIGVAPEAQWIAVKIFDDAGSATSGGIHQGFQWLLDPDGDSSTVDAPHVVNNSWNYASPGCNLDFQLDLQALRAAGIVPVFAAGNAGPYPSTSVSPANNPEAFAVGAVDFSDYVYYESSRGPSACDEDESIFPELVAPGVNILSSDRYGLYSEATGTSLSAPHVSGGLALLLSAYPDLTAADQEMALLYSVVDLGPAGPDNDSGYGRLDLLAAYYLLHGGDSGSTPTPTVPPPTPTPTDGSQTATPTSTLTPTPTPLPLVNLALNMPVTVSSYQDEGHTGQMALDGMLDTYWQTRKATGKKTLASEWIKVDLGSNATISGIVLQWQAYYATAYTIGVSEDDQNWSVLFATTSGDGGADAVSFEATVARYVMLESTAWTDGSKRNWLSEFEVYGTVSDPVPTPTSTPTATPTATPDWTPTSTATSWPTPTPTSTPPATPTPSPTWTPTSTPGAGLTVHVGDLDGSSLFIRKKWWEATVTVTVHDGSEVPLADVVVSGSWSDGASGTGSCLTGGSGQCTISLADMKDSVSSVTFTVGDLAAPGGTYQTADNHDADGDSDGTTIIVIMP